MGISEYVINILSAVVAVEYIDYGFQKKFCGVKRWSAFIVGCVVYFLTVTVLNRVIQFEGVLGFCYGAVLIGYGVWALKGKIQDFLLAGLLWVLIAILGTYGIFNVMGLLTGRSLGEMLQMHGGGRVYASVVALVVKFSMGKIAAILFRKREGVYERENRIVAGAFVFMTLLAMGLFWLEMGELRSTVRHVLTIGILLDEAGIIVVLIQLYHRLGEYQREKIEEQYRREREKERLEGLMDMPPPPLSMLPSPAAKAVAGNRHSTSTRVQRRVEKSFIMYHAPYIFVHSQIPHSRAAGYLALAAFAKWIGNLWFPVHPLGSLLADKAATIK